MKDNIVEFPDRKTVEAEAGEWLIRLDGDVTPSKETLSDLRAWLARGPAHREELYKLAAFWNAMNVLTELSVPMSRADESFIGACRAMFAGISRLFRPVAAFALGGAMIIAVMVYGPGQQSDSLQDSNGIYATAVGKQSTTILADGSEIILNTDTEVVVEFKRGFRDIRLVRGEAAFNVAKNPDRPFRVFAGNERVQAVGTAFTVYLQNDIVDITVTEGRVALATLNNPQSRDVPDRADKVPAAVTLANVTANDYVETLSSLIAGQSARIQVHHVNVAAATPSSFIDTVETVAEQDIAKRLSWREGMLTFSGDALVDVVREISRYTTMSIEFTEPEIGAIKIGGTFPVGETDLLLDSLEANFGLRVTRLSENHVLLTANGG